MFTRVISAAVLIASTFFPVSIAPAQDQSPCGAYVTAVNASQIGSSQKIPVVPESLLADWQRALTCLVPIIESLKSQVNEDVFTPETQARFMSATAAIRSIISRATAQDTISKNDSESRKVITAFRNLDNLDVTWVLSYGVRNQNPDIRLNALLILANVIDNTTLCVPLDHVFDEALEQSDHGKRGRANLLSVISVVAPWAYRENFKNIEAARDFVQRKVTGKDEFRDTQTILKNITERLASQRPNSNKAVSLTPSELRKPCQEYPLKWGKERLSF
jgi:hypothetical protein